MRAVFLVALLALCAGAGLSARVCRPRGRAPLVKLTYVVADPTSALARLQRILPSADTVPAHYSATGLGVCAMSEAAYVAPIYKELSDADILAMMAALCRALIHLKACGIDLPALDYALAMRRHTVTRVWALHVAHLLLAPSAPPVVRSPMPQPGEPDAAAVWALGVLPGLVRSRPAALDLAPDDLRALWLYAHVTGFLPAPFEDLPPALRGVCAQLLQLVPLHRPSLEDALRILQAALAGDPPRPHSK